MPSGHSEITAYVNEADIARVATALTALCVGQGMHEVTPPGRSGVRYVLSLSDRWTFALLAGAPGWTVVLAQPWNTLCRASVTGPSRFVDLCTALGVRGFMVDVIDVAPHGSALVETDGRGLHRISGWYLDESERERSYHGTPLELDDFQGTTFEICGDLTCAGLFEEHMSLLDLDRCAAIASEVGGANGDRLFTSGEDFCGAWDDVQQAMREAAPLPAEGGLVLQFEAEAPGVER